jgi:hypothetical protein
LYPIMSPALSPGLNPGVNPNDARAQEVTSPGWTSVDGSNPCAPSRTAQFDSSVFDASVNLLAPIVVNVHTGACAQVILDDQDWPLQAELATRSA